jgi:hypothetical protein
MICIRASLIGAAAVVATLASTTASATTFFFSFASNDGAEVATGELSATPNGDGTFTAVSGAITMVGPELISGTGALTPNAGAPGSIISPSGAFIYDDQLLPGQNPSITNPGLLFNVGGEDVNLYSNGPSSPVPNGTYYLQSFNGGYATAVGQFALTAVPEPAAWALMLVGIGLAGATLRSQAKRKLVLD